MSQKNPRGLELMARIKPIIAPTPNITAAPIIPALRVFLAEAMT